MPFASHRQRRNLTPFLLLNKYLSRVMQSAIYKIPREGRSDNIDKTNLKSVLICQSCNKNDRMGKYICTCANKNKLTFYG